MALTEPGAGSDLSGIRTRAVKTGEHWVLGGEKIFISGGDPDLSPHILHLVLARTGRPEEGTRGLSLFLAPSTEGGSARSSITVTRIEEKLGLHGSPTCQISYDGAKAELLGDLGGGLRAMFTLMNHARLEVSLHGLAHAARASHIARAHAAERVQGGKPLDRHADVRRMLDEAESLSLCGRIVTLTVMTELQRDDDTPLVDFLTPVAKVMGTMRASARQIWRSRCWADTAMSANTGWNRHGGTRASRPSTKGRTGSMRASLRPAACAMGAARRPTRSTR